MARAVWAVLRMLGAGGDSIAIWLVVLVVYGFVIYGSVAAGVKRLHDRDKNGWWLLPYYLLPALLGLLASMTDDPPLARVIHLAAIVFGFGAWSSCDASAARSGRTDTVPIRWRAAGMFSSQY
jgi:uncharacterized membrane protein YhaH (DUF805 family)